MVNAIFKNQSITFKYIPLPPSPCNLPVFHRPVKSPYPHSYGLSLSYSHIQFSTNGKSYSTHSKSITFPVKISFRLFWFSSSPTPLSYRSCHHRTLGNGKFLLNGQFSFPATDPSSHCIQTDGLKTQI